MKITVLQELLYHTVIHSKKVWKLSADIENLYEKLQFNKKKIIAQ